jgi:YbbR domain-containing protein
MAFRFPIENPRELQPVISLWLRKAFLEDWSTKLIALAVTLALWFGISGQQTPGSRPLSELPLKIRLSNEMEIINEPPRLVEVTLTGDKGKLDRLDKNYLTVSIDLSDRPPGEWKVDLKPADVTIEELPAGIKIDKIEPRSFLVKLEKRAEGEVEVKPEFEGHLPDGLEVYEEQTVVTPAEVRVSGPSSFVNSMDSIATDKISLEDRKADFSLKQVAVNLMNTKITVLDTVVDVFVKIGPKRSVRNIAVRAQTPWGTEQTLTVTLTGAQQDLEKVDSKAVRIEWEKLSDQTAKPSASLSAGSIAGITVKSITPVTVKSGK